MGRVAERLDALGQRRRRGVRIAHVGLPLFIDSPSIDRGTLSDRRGRGHPPRIENTLRIEFRLEPRGKNLLYLHRFTGSLEKQRERWLNERLASPPDETVGKYAYSNAGYTLLGIVAEKLGAQSWELQLQERLWRPLGITGGGFGAPPQIWQHVVENVNAGMGGEITNLKISDPAATREPFTMSYDVARPNYLDWSKKKSD